MTASPVVSKWDETVVPQWGHRPMKLGHTLHTSPLFSRSALADLIASYPRERYALVNMGAQKDRRLWREGEIGGLSGDAVIEAISRGRMWLNLRDVSQVDARYRAVLDEIFGELSPDHASDARSRGVI